jgi:hypothetical protein
LSLNFDPAALPENGIGFSVQLANLLSDNPVPLAELANATKQNEWEKPSGASKGQENYSYPKAISEIPIPL